MLLLQRPRMYDYTVDTTWYDFDDNFLPVIFRFMQLEQGGMDTPKLIIYRERNDDKIADFPEMFTHINIDSFGVEHRYPNSTMMGLKNYLYEGTDPMRVFRKTAYTPDHVVMNPSDTLFGTNNCPFFQGLYLRMGYVYRIKSNTPLYINQKNSTARKNNTLFFPTSEYPIWQTSFSQTKNGATTSAIWNWAIRYGGTSPFDIPYHNLNYPYAEISENLTETALIPLQGNENFTMSPITGGTH